MVTNALTEGHRIEPAKHYSGERWSQRFESQISPRLESLIHNISFKHLPPNAGQATMLLKDQFLYQYKYDVGIRTKRSLLLLLIFPKLSLHNFETASAGRP